MKKFILLLFMSTFFVNCNDGDLYFDNLNFPGNVQKCSEKEVYYKLNGNEMLFLNMINEFKEGTSIPLNETKIVDASGKIVYRQYSDKAIPGSICNAIAPAFPQVVEEFNVANGGNIEYQRIRRIIQKETEKHKVDIEYILTFKFKNIVLQNGDKQLKFENYNFGEFMDSKVNFDFSKINLSKCENSSDLFSLNTQELFRIVSNQINFPNTSGSETITLNENNYAAFYYLNTKSIITSEQACNIDNIQDIIKENWKATQGTLEVVTTIVPVSEAVVHTIILKNVTFKNGQDSFTIEEQKINVN